MRRLFSPSGYHSRALARSGYHNRASATASTANPLHSDQIQAYERDGFLLVRGALSPSTISRLREEVERIEQWGHASIGKAPEQSKGLHHFESLDNGEPVLARSEDVLAHSPAIKSLLIPCDATVPCIASQLLGEPAVLYKVGVIRKLESQTLTGFVPYSGKGQL